MLPLIFNDATGTALAVIVGVFVLMAIAGHAIKDDEDDDDGDAQKYGF